MIISDEIDSNLICKSSTVRAATFKTVYLYDPVTGEFTEEYKAQLSPLDVEEKYLCPIFHSEAKPPVTGKNEVAIFEATKSPSVGNWEILDDFRGTVIYSELDNTQEVVKVLGLIPKGYSVVPIPPPEATIEQKIKKLEIAVQDYLDKIAQDNGYDNLNSMSKYASITDDQIKYIAEDLQETVLMYRTQCKTFICWAASVWAFCYNNKSTVSLGKIPLPTEKELIAALPAVPKS